MNTVYNPKLLKQLNQVLMFLIENNTEITKKEKKTTQVLSLCH